MHSLYSFRALLHSPASPLPLTRARSERSSTTTNAFISVIICLRSALSRPAFKRFLNLSPDISLQKILFRTLSWTMDFLGSFPLLRSRCHWICQQISATFQIHTIWTIWEAYLSLFNFSLKQRSSSTTFLDWCKPYMSLRLHWFIQSFWIYNELHELVVPDFEVNMMALAGRTHW